MKSFKIIFLLVLMVCNGSQLQASVEDSSFQDVKSMAQEYPLTTKVCANIALVAGGAAYGWLGAVVSDLIGKECAGLINTDSYTKDAVWFLAALATSYIYSQVVGKEVRAYEGSLMKSAALERSPFRLAAIFMSGWVTHLKYGNEIILAQLARWFAMSDTLRP